MKNEGNPKLKSHVAKIYIREKLFLLPRKSVKIFVVIFRFIFFVEQVISEKNPLNWLSKQQIFKAASLDIIRLLSCLLIVAFVVAIKTSSFITQLRFYDDFFFLKIDPSTFFGKPQDESAEIVLFHSKNNWHRKISIEKTEKNSQGIRSNENRMKQCLGPDAFAFGQIQRGQ